MSNERITRAEITAYKQDILETTVLVRLDEAATILAVHPDTVRSRIDAGLITPYNDSRTGKNIRILASELRRYVQEMRGKMKRE